MDPSSALSSSQPSTLSLTPIPPSTTTPAQSKKESKAKKPKEDDDEKATEPLTDREVTKVCLIPVVGTIVYGIVAIVQLCKMIVDVATIIFHYIRSGSSILSLDPLKARIQKAYLTHDAAEVNLKKAQEAYEKAAKEVDAYSFENERLRLERELDAKNDAADRTSKEKFLDKEARNTRRLVENISQLHTNSQSHREAEKKESDAFNTYRQLDEKYVKAVEEISEQFNSQLDKLNSVTFLEVASLNKEIMKLEKAIREYQQLLGMATDPEQSKRIKVEQQQAEIDLAERQKDLNSLNARPESLNRESEVKESHVDVQTIIQKSYQKLLSMEKEVGNAKKAWYQAQQELSELEPPEEMQAAAEAEQKFAAAKQASNDAFRQQVEQVKAKCQQLLTAQSEALDTQIEAKANVEKHEHVMKELTDLYDDFKKQEGEGDPHLAAMKKTKEEFKKNAKLFGMSLLQATWIGAIGLAIYNAKHPSVVPVNPAKPTSK